MLQHNKWEDLEGANALTTHFLLQSKNQDKVGMKGYRRHEIKDGAYYCYCAYVLRISRYSDFLSAVLINTGILVRGKSYDLMIRSKTTDISYSQYDRFTIRLTNRVNLNDLD